MHIKSFFRQSKSFLLVVFALLLVVPSLLNIINSTKPVSAASGDNVVVIKIKDWRGNDNNFTTPSFSMIVIDNTITYTAPTDPSDDTENQTSDFYVTSGGITQHVQGFFSAIPDHIYIYASDGTTLLHDEKIKGTGGTITVSLSEGASPSPNPSPDPSKISSPSFSISEWNGVCKKQAGILGFILCPFIQSLYVIMDGIYSGIIGQLEIDTGLFTDTNIDKAWAASRDVANILFIIFILFVIFSQVTGFGIDNYGIKKTLPKVVVVALAINLSFFICEAMVDVSNIIGSGLYKFLGSADIAGGGGYDGGSYIASFGVGLFTGVGVLTGLAMPIIVMVVLIHCISASITMLFITLARKIGLIILVAVSPLAFATFLLPNTESLFKKWWGWFKPLLILYPVCAVFVRSGQVLGNILAAGADGDAILGILAMCAPVLPYWFLPKFLKGSLGTLGIVGQKMADWRARRAIGRKRRAKKALAAAKNSQAYRSAVNTAKLKAVKSTAGKGVQSRFNKWSNSSNKLTSFVGMAGKNAIAGTVANAQREKQATDAKNRANSRYTDSTPMTAFLKGDDLVTEGTEGATPTEMTRGDYYARLQDQRARQLDEIDDEMVHDPEYLRSIDEQRSGAKVKMYSGAYGQLDIGELQEALRQSMSDGGEDQAERFVSAFNRLVQAGQIDKAREVIATSDNFGELMNNDESFRNKVLQQFGASGEFTMQEYAKYAGSHRGNARSFGEWADARDGDSLKAAIQAKGLDRLDKDALDFISRHSAALEGISPDNLSKVAANTSDAATVAKLVKMIEALSPEARKATIARTSADRAANMDQSVRDALAGKTASTPADNSLWQAQIGEAIRDNPQIAARFSPEVRSTYVAAGPPTESNVINQEYTRYATAAGSNARTYEQWASANDGDSLQSFVRNHGIDHADAATFRTISMYPAAMAAISPDSLARAVANTTDTSAIRELTNVIRNLSQATREATIAQTTASTNLPQTIRDALAGARPAMGASPAVAPNDELWRKQIGAALRDNPQIAIHYTPEQIRRYAAAPAAPATAQPKPTINTDTQWPPRDEHGNRIPLPDRDRH